jgi:hypothetical protein
MSLALPSSPQKPDNGESSTLARPKAHPGMKKLRKKKRANNLNRALDEHDDVDDSDLVAGPAKRQRIRTADGDGDGDDESSEDEEGDAMGDGNEDEVEEKVVKGGKEGETDRLEKRNTRRKKQA